MTWYSAQNWKCDDKALAGAGWNGRLPTGGEREGEREKRRAPACRPPASLPPCQTSETCGWARRSARVERNARRPVVHSTQGAPCCRSLALVTSALICLPLCPSSSSLHSFLSLSSSPPSHSCTRTCARIPCAESWTRDNQASTGSCVSQTQSSMRSSLAL